MTCLKKGLFAVLLVALSLGGEACSQARKTVSADKGEVTEATMKAGAGVFSQNCAVCHQADGTGVPHLNPPLVQTDYVLGAKPRLIQVVLKGLDAHEPINGEVYSNVMPAHDFLSDQEVADVLTYIRNSFENQATAVTAAEVAAERARLK